MVALGFLSVAIALSDTSYTLEQCLEQARRNNPEIQKAQSGIRAAKGETIVARSRLLPQLHLDYRSGWLEPGGAADSLLQTPIPSGYREDQSLDLELRQRLIEFGRTSESEYERLRAKRRAVYAYEDKIVETFRLVREAYFSLRITRGQLQQHDSLLGLYSERLKQEENRLESGVALRSAVLTARLNRLEEMERIHRLRFAEREQLARLKRALGSESPGDIVLLSEPAAPQYGLDSAVSAALARSTRIADAEAEALLARKQMRETGWEVFPSISAAGRVNRGSHSLAVEAGKGLPNTRHEWAFDLVATETLLEKEGDLLDRRLAGETLFPSVDDDLKYTAALRVRFPLFQGRRVVGERMRYSAHYQAAREELISEAQQLELEVRQAHFGFTLARELLEIRREKVEIDRERYQLSETLHQMGRLSEDGLNDFRERYFASQDAFFGQQYEVLNAAERLRALVRDFR